MLISRINSVINAPPSLVFLGHASEMLDEPAALREGGIGVGGTVAFEKSVCTVCIADQALCPTLRTV